MLVEVRQTTTAAAPTQATFEGPHRTLAEPVPGERGVRTQKKIDPNANGLIVLVSYSASDSIIFYLPVMTPSTFCLLKQQRLSCPSWSWRMVFLSEPYHPLPYLVLCLLSKEPV